MTTNGVIYPYWENAARMAESYAALYLLLGTLLAIMPGVCLTIVLVKFVTVKFARAIIRPPTPSKTVWRKTNANTISQAASEHKSPGSIKEPGDFQSLLQGICYLTCHRVQPVSYAQTVCRSWGYRIVMLSYPLQTVSHKSRVILKQI